VFGKNGSSFLYILTVCRENSDLNPDALNHNAGGSVDVGVGQINAVNGVRVSNGVAYTVEQLKDYRTNIKVSYEIFQRRGNWGAWYGCRDHNNGVYPTVY
jgi:hypothetical protein